MRAPCCGVPPIRTFIILGWFAEFGCQRCRFVLTAPLTTPCGHNFCKTCLEAATGGEELRDRAAGARSLRVKKVVKVCPACKADITDFMSNPQVGTIIKVTIW